MFKTMPKAELHVHLDGSIPPQTVLEIAKRNQLLEVLPASDEEGLAKWFAFQDFYHFADIVRVIKSLLRNPDDFALAVYAMGREMAAQQIRYAEVTITPYTYIGYLKTIKIDHLLEGLEAGRQQVRAEFGIELRWIFDIPRNRAFSDYRNGGDYVPGAAEDTLAFALQGRAYGVIGLGLGGNEVNAPPQPFAHVFAEAKRYGLLSLPHAGESEGNASIWGAIDDLQADRVGHGIRAVEDERLVQALAQRQIPLEVSMTCNVALKFSPSVAEHPFRHLEAAGVLVTVNTDDPILVGTTLTQEYEQLKSILGYSDQAIIAIARTAFQVCGAEASLKERLLTEFDEWAASALRQA